MKVTIVWKMWIAAGVQLPNHVRTFLQKSVHFLAPRCFFFQIVCFISNRTNYSFASLLFCCASRSFCCSWRCCSSKSSICDRYMSLTSWRSICNSSVSSTFSPYIWRTASYCSCSSLNWVTTESWVANLSLIYECQWKRVKFR